MEYYKFSDEELATWIERTTPQMGAIKLSASRKDTVYYFVNQLGIKPLPWQIKVLDWLDEGCKRIIVCTPRQVGKSLLLSGFALKAMDLNTFPSGVTKKTKIGIVSKTEQQAMKIISDIKEYIKMGDLHVETMTAGKIKGYFSKKIDRSQNASNNKSQITFTNGCSIISLPPTGKIKGYSFSYLFIDEAAHIDDPDTYYIDSEPTVNATNGTILLTSTPNGRQGFYFDIFDPYEDQDKHEYKRFWLHYDDLHNQEMIDRILDKKQQYYARGQEKRFQQEYDAMFTVQASSFFDNDDVVEMFEDNDLSKLEFYEGQCDMSIDFGMVNSHTIITISRLSKQGVIERIYHYRYDFGKDDNLIEDMESLIKRFKVQRIIPDDCPEGYSWIQEMEKKGWNIKPMSFRRDKVKKYFAFRSWLRQRKIKSYKDKVLEQEMAALQEEESVRSTKIYKPHGGTDDMIDAFVMSCYFYLEPKVRELKTYDLWDEEDDN